MAHFSQLKRKMNALDVVGDSDDDTPANGNKWRRRKFISGSRRSLQSPAIVFVRDFCRDVTADTFANEQKCKIVQRLACRVSLRSATNDYPLFLLAVLLPAHFAALPVVFASAAAKKRRTAIAAQNPSIFNPEGCAFACSALLTGRMNVIDVNILLSACALSVAHSFPPIRSAE